MKDHLAELALQAEQGSNAVAYYLATQLFECRRFTSANPGPANEIQGLPGLSADCRGLGAADVEQFRHWAQLAADRGSAEAQVGYGVLVGDTLSVNDALRDPAALADYKQRTLAYLHQAAASGYAPALRRWSNVYADGVLVPQDLARAYAYRLAYLEAVDQTPSTAEAALAARLTDAQRQQAQALARTISSGQHPPQG